MSDDEKKLNALEKVGFEKITNGNTVEYFRGSDCIAINHAIDNGKSILTLAIVAHLSTNDREALSEVIKEMEKEGKTL
jgi:hypothetical protein